MRSQSAASKSGPRCVYTIAQIGISTAIDSLPRRLRPSIWSRPPAARHQRLFGSLPVCSVGQAASCHIERGPFSSGRFHYDEQPNAKLILSFIEVLYTATTGAHGSQCPPGKRSNSARSSVCAPAHRSPTLSQRAPMELFGRLLRINMLAVSCNQPDWHAGSLLASRSCLWMLAEIERVVWHFLLCCCRFKVPF